MKNAKYYRNLALTAFILTFAGCKNIHHPVDKNVYSIVNGIYEVDNIQTDVTLNLENEQTLVLHKREMFGQTHDKDLPNYKIGDTVWFHYTQDTKRYGEVFSSDVLKNPSNEMKDYLREQQKELFAGKRR